MVEGKFHPTCHKIPLTPVTKCVAFFDLVFGLFGLIWFVLMLSRYDIISLDPFENMGEVSHNTSKTTSLDRLTSLPGEDQGQRKQAFATSHKVISLSLVAFYTTVNLTVFVILLIGVYKRSPGICLTWFYIRCAIFVFKAIILVIYCIGGRPLYSQLPFILSMVVHLYGLWVVSWYVDELREAQYGVQIEEVKVKNEKAAVEAFNNDDEPNGIEAIQRQRLELRLTSQILKGCES